MRKKTINLIIGFLIGIFIAILSTISLLFYYKNKINLLVNNYEKQINQLENPKTAEVFQLVNDIIAGQEIKINDLKKVNIPLQFISNNMILNENDIKNKLYYSKFNLNKGDILNSYFIYSKDEIPVDLRKFEVSGIVMPVGMKLGDYIDIRISFNSGLDFSILTKKQVKEILTIGENEEKIEYYVFHLNTEEILRFQSALVDAYINEGTFLYSTIYIDPNKQEAAKITYPVNKYVQELISNDPNIVNKAKEAVDEKKREILNNSLNNSKNRKNIINQNRKIVKKENIIKLGEDYE